jgi:hypothetical protein
VTATQLQSAIHSVTQSELASLMLFPPALGRRCGACRLGCCRWRWVSLGPQVFRSESRLPLELVTHSATAIGDSLRVALACRQASACLPVSEKLRLCVDEFACGGRLRLWIQISQRELLYFTQPTHKRLHANQQPAS